METNAALATILAIGDPMIIRIGQALAAVAGFTVLAGMGIWLANMPSSDIRGTWISPAYGQALKISALQAQAYSVTSISCYRERRFPAHLGLVHHLAGVTIEPSPTGINLHLDGALEPIPYVRANLPEACDDPMHRDTGAIHTFDVFWTAMNEHYPFFALHDVDWEDRRRFAPTSDVTSNDELANQLQRAVEGLDDGHLILSMGDQEDYSPSKQPKWLAETPQLTRAQLWDTAISNTGIKVEKTEGISVRYGLRPDGIGYIAIKEMEVQTDWGQSMHDATVEAFADVANALKDAKGLIVDVRYNPGGSDSVSMALAGFFTEEPRTAFTKLAWEKPEFTMPFQATVAPVIGNALSQPTVVLTGGLTGSAAEIFTLTLREFPNVTTMGSATSGGLSDVLEFTLPNGWKVGLSAQKYVSLDGEVFEKDGIPADVQIPPNGELLLRGQDKTLSRALQYISDQVRAENGT